MKDHKKEKPFIPEQTEKETKRGGRKLIRQAQTPSTDTAHRYTSFREAMSNQVHKIFSIS